MGERNLKKNLTTAVSALIFVVGLTAFTYPIISNFINSKTQTKIVADYSAAAHDFDPDYKIKLLDAAEIYNSKVYKTYTPLFNPVLIGDYENILDVSGTGIIGYINIGKLGLELPIYHGTSDAVLKSGIGHLEGSSFPIGGVNTHSCLTGHRGLPSSELFTHLDKIEIGDDFMLTVLNQTLVYTVDSIQIVEPYEFDSLFIREGEDLCTLITCTPYGVNSQRLLVHGTRSPDLPVDVLVENQKQPSRAGLKTAEAAAVSAAALFFTWLSVFALRRRKSKNFPK